MRNIAIILILANQIFFGRSAIILDKSRNSLVERLSKREMFWHCLGQFGLVVHSHICICVVQSHSVTFTLRHFPQILLIKFLLLLILAARTIYFLSLRLLTFEIIYLLCSEFFWWSCFSSLLRFKGIISLLWVIVVWGWSRALSLRIVSSVGSFSLTSSMSQRIRWRSQTWSHFFQQIFLFHLFVLIKVLNHGNLSFKAVNFGRSRRLELLKKVDLRIECLDDVLIFCQFLGFCWQIFFVGI